MAGKMLHISEGLLPNSLETETLDAPDYLPGDAQFLDDDPTRAFQIRPILPSEMLPGRHYTPGDRMVVARANGKVWFRGFVRLPSQARKNTRANTNLALKKMAKLTPLATKLIMAYARQGGPKPV